jgi:hypothetical protein
MFFKKIKNIFNRLGEKYLKQDKNIITHEKKEIFTSKIPKIKQLKK